MCLYAHLIDQGLLERSLAYVPRMEIVWRELQELGQSIDAIRVLVRRRNHHRLCRPRHAIPRARIRRQRLSVSGRR